VRATGGERRQRGAPCLVAQLELARLLRALVLARPRLDVGHALGGRLALTREFGLLHAVLGVALLLRRRLLLEALALLIRRPVGIVLGGAATALRECGALALKALAISLALWRGRRLLRRLLVRRRLEALLHNAARLGGCHVIRRFLAAITLRALVLRLLGGSGGGVGGCGLGGGRRLGLLRQLGGGSGLLRRLALGGGVGLAFGGLLGGETLCLFVLLLAEARLLGGGAGLLDLGTRGGGVVVARRCGARCGAERVLHLLRDGEENLEKDDGAIVELLRGVEAKHRGEREREMRRDMNETNEALARDGRRHDTKSGVGAAPRPVAHRSWRHCRHTR
jgi:hypothetical protein